MVKPPVNKKLAFDALTKDGRSVFIHVCPARAGVHVPPTLGGKIEVVFQVGFNMPVPIPDLRADEKGWSGTLSFNRVPFHVEVPWEGVFAMVNEDAKGMVWGADVPEEVALRMTARAAKQVVEPKPAGQLIDARAKFQNEHAVTEYERKLDARPPVEGKVISLAGRKPKGKPSGAA